MQTQSVSLLIAKCDGSRLVRFRICLVASTVLWILGVAYWVWSPDPLAMFHLCPRWTWWLAGVAPVGLAFFQSFSRWRVLLSAMLVWCVSGIILVEESRSLARGWIGASPTLTRNQEHRRLLRIVTLNCGSGGGLPVRDALDWNPDIVLLQESPSRAELEALAAESFGENASVIWSSDASIMSRFPILDDSIETGSCFVRARVPISNGLNLSVISLRLQPPLIRLDFWRAACWQSYQTIRNKHRQQLREVIADGLPRNVNGSDAVFVGGDFNLVALDPGLEVLPHWLSDSFRTAGRGWGNTIVSDFPVHRIDQIWTTWHFSPKLVRAVYTPHSDHRMIVADFEFDDGPLVVSALAPAINAGL